ncbi:hypothetical protein OESDEN_19247 [Oesophagostomum dentatum]|uniref:Uncharacterized protein n=1 Tax=Oesophagostomum dentatum TaxID=61180 RepID=A0A0B1S816_OESDE|nr:hypothetical protein OESDEN_19247 [Oesophagostomum dentatum]
MGRTRSMGRRTRRMGPKAFRPTTTAWTFLGRCISDLFV